MIEIPLSRYLTTLKPGHNGFQCPESDCPVTGVQVPNSDANDSICGREPERPDSRVEAQRKSWMQTISPMRRVGGIPPVPKTREASAEYHASFISLVFFQWIAPLIAVGHKRQLEEEDIWAMNPSRMVAARTVQFEDAFTRLIARGDKYPLLWTLMETFHREIWIGGACQLFASILQVISPFTLRYLIRFAQDAYNSKLLDQPRTSVGKGIALVIGITVMQVLQSLGTHQLLYTGNLLGGQARASLITAIYKKAMVFSEPATTVVTEDGLVTKVAGAHEKAGWDDSRVFHLMSIDTARVDQACSVIHMVWATPIACIVTLVLLLVNLSYSALAGFGLLSIGVPTLSLALKRQFWRRKAIDKMTNERISLTLEVIDAIKFFKCFGWESSLLTRLSAIRGSETDALWVLSMIRNAINALSISLPILSSMLAFITYSLTRHGLGPSHIFSSLALFNTLRLPLSLLPLVLGQAIDAFTALARIQSYLTCEELAEINDNLGEGGHTVVLIDADFTWEHNILATSSTMSPTTKTDTGMGTPLDDCCQTPFKLRGLTFKVQKPELVAIIGGIGSGKSSLLAALASEMRKTRGHAAVRRAQAFSPQDPWIQNTTVRENILFGQEMNSEWYESVLDACALRHDLKLLSDGDMTVIGERGITISGGQKQRISLARAIYSNADLILLDDPLSAVDSQVGQHIFQTAILGILKEKSCILATHQRWVLSHCDKIIWLENGTIKAHDTFESLIRSSPDFRILMENTVEQQHDEISAIDKANIEDKAKPVQVNLGVSLMEAEKGAHNTRWTVYLDYARTSQSFLCLTLVIVLLVCAQVATLMTSIWLAWWTSNKLKYSTGIYTGVYIGLGITQTLLLFLFGLSLAVIGTYASNSIHNKAIIRLLRAPMSFFDTTPVGQIASRFSHDINVLDNKLAEAFRLYLLNLTTVLSIFGLIIVYFPYFALPLGLLSFVLLIVYRYYKASAKQLKHFQSTRHSTVYAKFNEGVAGASCIRSYQVVDAFVIGFQRALDDMNAACFLEFANQRWGALRIDLIGNLLVLTTGIFVITSRFDVSPSIVGVVLNYVLSVVQTIQYTFRQLEEVDNSIHAIDRLHYYATQLEQEAPLSTTHIRESWPESGEIIFHQVHMVYPGQKKADEPTLFVLRGLTMQIKGGEHVGIVGRTGAGKSSIFATIFRLVELSSGSITIDGLNISTIGLSDLRSRLTIIPQHPNIFKGTIRSNLDPFNEYTDIELWSALRRSQLLDQETSSPDDGTPRSGISLDTVVQNDGSNLSLGQRQLVSLARALVRRPRIILCDEPTRSLDVETDNKIQTTIREGFKGTTLLCIAHRLRTVLHCDKVCVVDHGRIAEFDAPLVLYDRGLMFTRMCERSGICRKDIIDLA